MNTIERQPPKVEMARMTPTIPPCQLTVEELKADIEQAEEDFRNGKVHTQEEVKKAIASW